MSDFEGKPRRSDEAIRNSLAKISAPSESVAAGDLKSGLANHAPVLLYVFNSKEAFDACQNLIRAEGIYLGQERRRDGFALTVDYQDRDRAGRMIDEYLSTHPDRKSERLKFDYAILGAMLGGSFGAIPMLATLNPQILGFAVGAALIGVMIGVLLDRWRYRRRIGQKSIFGLIDLMLLVASVCLVAALPSVWTFIIKH